MPLITNILFATLSAYCHCADCCGEANQPTASGRWPVVGRTIAAPRRIPFGTKVILPNGKILTVEDRLAKRFDHRFDVFLSSHMDAKKFGKNTKQKLKLVYEKPNTPNRKTKVRAKN